MYKSKVLLLTLFVVALFSVSAVASTARLQVIHNAADPGAASVDIYLNDGLLLDDFAFRAATPFIDAPANQDISIGVAHGTSSSVNEPLYFFHSSRAGPL